MTGLRGLADLSLFALASASLGILLGTLFKDPDKCASTAVWTAIVLAPLGGLRWPLEIVGPTMRRLAYFVPTGWAMEGVNAMLAFGAGCRSEPATRCAAPTGRHRATSNTVKPAPGRARISNQARGPGCKLCRSVSEP